MIDEAMTDWVEKGNPCHTASGPKGGEFCSTGGKSGLVAAPKDRSEWPAHTQALVIPPAWRDVMLNPNPHAALQVTGRDAAGRLQYVYSKKHSDAQAKAKFARIKELDSKFDGIRKQNEGNLRSKDPRIREHAECASLVMGMGLRPGSDADTKAKVQAYGATTLLGKHVVVSGDQVRLQFTGKKGVALDLPVTDRALAAMLKARTQEAGKDGRLFPQVDAKSLRDYSHTMDGGGFKTKDFRTLVGTREAMNQIKAMQPPSSHKEYVARVKAVAKAVAARLGNTPTVALQSYISPAVFAPWRAYAPA